MSEIVITRQEVCVRDVRHPFRWIYRLARPVPNEAGVLVDYSGTPLGSLRTIARKLAGPGGSVREDWR